MPVEIWKHGPAPRPVTEVGAFARQMEELGWDGLSIVEDSGIIADVYIALALAAATTSRLRLGTGTASPSRHPLLHANAIATLHGISNGRSWCSFGRGDVALSLLGRRPASVDEFAVYIERVQGYLRREEVQIDHHLGSIRGLFGFDPSMDVTKPPIDIVATGPRMTALAATLGDSVSFSVGADIDRLKGCIDLARSARAAAGLDPMGIKLGCYITGAVVTNHDRSNARDIIRPAVMVMSRHVHGHGGEVSPSFDSVEVSDDVVDAFGLVAEPSEFAERLNEIASLGMDRIIITTRVPTTDTSERNCERIGELVLPLLR